MAHHGTNRRSGQRIQMFDEVEDIPRQAQAMNHGLLNQMLRAMCDIAGRASSHTHGVPKTQNA